MGLKLREFDAFTDHSIRRYIAYIRRAILEEESAVKWLAPPRPQFERGRRPRIAA